MMEQLMNAPSMSTMPGVPPMPTASVPAATP
jgi:hypothetical protein